MKTKKAGRLILKAVLCIGLAVGHLGCYSEGQYQPDKDPLHYRNNKAVHSPDEIAAETAGQNVSLTTVQL